MPAPASDQIDRLVDETRHVMARDGLRPEEAMVRVLFGEIVRGVVMPELIAKYRRRSLSPALEGDLAAFCCTPDFARAVERVGEVEQGGAALPFARRNKFVRPNAQGFGVDCIVGKNATTVLVDEFHAPKLRASVVPRQCDASPVLHPENVQ